MRFQVHKKLLEQCKMQDVHYQPQMYHRDVSSFEEKKEKKKQTYHE